MQPEAVWKAKRQSMVDEIRGSREVSERALQALLDVERHRFVPARWRPDSYRNHPLPIGCGQTISQPSMVAWLADVCDARTGIRILEIGTGCGYQAAIFAAMGADVCSIEVRARLARVARRNLDRAGFQRVRTKIDDGANGWGSEELFDVVALTAAPSVLPPKFPKYVRDGGFVVAPIGPTNGMQQLIRYTVKCHAVVRMEVLGGVRFVPLVDQDLNAR